MQTVATLSVPTAGLVHDLTTVEAINAELTLTSSSENDAAVSAQITLCSKMIAEFCDCAGLPPTFAEASVSQTFRLYWGEHPHMLPLRHFPVSAIDSVTEDDVLLDSINYELHPNSGMLHRLNGHWRARAIIVQYTGGYSLPDNSPANLERACIELIKQQRMTVGRDASIRDIWAGENRVSYYQATPANGGLPISVSSLIEPFRRLA